MLAAVLNFPSPVASAVAADDGGGLPWVLDHFFDALVDVSLWPTNPAMQSRCRAVADELNRVGGKGADRAGR